MIFLSIQNISLDPIDPLLSSIDPLLFSLEHTIVPVEFSHTQRKDKQKEIYLEITSIRRKSINRKKKKKKDKNICQHYGSMSILQDIVIANVSQIFIFLKYKTILYQETMFQKI